jgi:hypothetical protein
VMKGVIFTDGNGNPLELKPAVPAPIPVPVRRTDDMVTQAVRHGTTFHRHPDGSHVATAGARRVCGFRGDSVEFVARAMLIWLEWERVR